MAVNRHAIAAVVIGRNEGARLEACLHSVRRDLNVIVYVDSGSTDGSVELARGLGADGVELSKERPFTAGGGRNSGFARFREAPPQAEFVQFIDGDCELQPGWIETAEAAL